MTPIADHTACSTVG